MAIDAGTILAHIDMDAAGFMGAMDGAAQRLGEFALGELPGALEAATGAMRAIMGEGAGEEAAAQWMQGARGGVAAGAGPLALAAEDAGRAAVDAAGAQMSQAAGEGLGAALAQGMREGVIAQSGALEAAAHGAAQQAADAAAEAMSAARGREMGEALTAGMAQGVRSGAGSVYAAVSAVAAQAVRRARQALDIHSPSGVFAEEVGAWIPSGIGEGVRTHAQEAIGQVERMRGGLIEAMGEWGPGQTGAARAQPSRPSPAREAARESVRIEVTGDWVVRQARDREEIIAALGERIGEALRRR